MKNVRFMSNNFLLSTMTYSSQLSSFPATNSTNTSRSKVWKPAGNFEISSTNKKLYINDGTDKTITLTEGAYNYTTLASHIQTQLNASSTNWSCSYDTALETFKFTISRSSGTAILRESVTTDAVWDTLGFTSTTDVSGSPFVADEQRNHTSEWIKCDLGIPQLATFGGILSGIDQIFTLSTSATVKVQANNIDYWASPPVDISITPGSTSAMSFLDANTNTYRFWRFEIKDRQNYRGPEGLEFAFVYIGDHTTITNTNWATGFSKELTDPSNLLQSESGALFFEKRPRYLTLNNCSIQLINAQERENIEQLFYDIGTREPMFVSIDPDVSVSLALEELTRFMVMTQPPTLEHVLRDYYNISFQMREAF